eukprot:TRINITY_DN7859_c0_g1_i1.p1 TRINITY_DN7859_c0_g1~~TRINITY_DN7859_c0_g1_i1.p1  ORF type:complete len:197 (-),score=2.60 TRINITY_DN7859_c0_g1_i1:190-744(-)
MTASSHFFVMITGQIESCEVSGADNLYCHYSIHMGQDWSGVAGPEEGLTQIGQKGGPRHAVVWNFPLDLTFKSSNVFGWPQLVLAVYGLDGLGRDVVRGYGSVHFPTSTGHHELLVHLFAPQSASPLQRITAWAGANQAEFVDSKFAAKAAGRDVVRVSSNGMVRIRLNVATKDMQNSGYAVGS